MKLREIYDELLTMAKNLGYVIRKENGNFHGGNCVLKDQKLILLNKNTPLEIQTGVVAKSFTEEIVGGIYLKPAIRDYIEKEWKLKENINFNLEVNIPENNLKKPK